MKREVRRDVILPAFSIGIAELELIWARLEPIFAGLEQVNFYVVVEFEHGEKLVLESLGELRNTKYPRTETTSFSLHCHSETCSVHIYTPPHSGSRPTLVVTSDSDVQAAGAREVVLAVIYQNRAWYNWLRSLFGPSVGLMLAGFLGGTVGFMIALGMPLFNLTTVALAVTVLLFFWMASLRNGLFPLAKLRLSEVQPFWKKYSAELYLIFAGIPALIAIGTLIANLY